MRDTWPLLERIEFPALRRGRLDTLQVNVGYRCNQSCTHCHVNAGPEPHRGNVGARSPTWCSRFLARQRHHHARHHRRRAGAQRAFPPPRDRRARPGRPRHGSLQSHGPGGARTGRPRPSSCATTRSRSSPRCRAISKTMSIVSAARACSTARSAACGSSTRWATGAKGSRPRAQSRLQSARARRCRRRRRTSKPTTSACSASATASCSTASTRSPTCRSSASARS